MGESIFPPFAAKSFNKSDRNDSPYIIAIVKLSLITSELDLSQVSLMTDKLYVL